ncbi:MAG TPA: hypothetical protein VGF92_17285, partial [Stellaceae bacterium]
LAGAFDDRYRIAGDYDWFLRVVTHPRLVIRRFERIIASYHSDGVSNRLDLSQREAFVIQNSVPVFRQPEWLQRRIGIYLRDSLSYSLRGVALAGRLGPYIWLREASKFSGRIIAYPFERLAASLGSRTRRGRALDQLQERVLRQRIRNDDLERLAEDGWQTPVSD